MELFWNPWAAPYFVGAAVAVALACAAYAGRPWRVENRSLAAYFLLHAGQAIGVALMVSTRAPPEAAAFRLLHIVLIGPTVLTYVLFLSTFDTPLARPLARPWSRRAIVASSALVPLIMLANDEAFLGTLERTVGGGWYFAPTPALARAFWSGSLVSFFGLAVAISALRRQPPGSATRQKLAAYALAFLVQDAADVLLWFGYPVVRFIHPSAGLFYWFAAPAKFLVVSAILGYGILRHQPLGIDVRRRDVRDGDGGTRRTLYRAALEAALAGDDDEKPREERLLARLRRDLGIGEREHGDLVREVRAARLRFRAERRGRFVVERELGAGGEGRAWLARDRELDRLIVLKQPHERAPPDARVRLLREARAAARIRDPNVVTVHEILSDEEPPILVLEHVPGGSLEDALRREGPLAPARATRLAMDVLRGLERIHDEGLLHRDLKPANVLLDHDGTAKISDFGLASAPDAPSLRAGTHGYVAPEVLRGAPPDVRSDIWSVGALLHAALTGGAPAGVSTVDALRPESALVARHAMPAGPLRDVIERALDEDPARRFADARAMRDAVEVASPRAAAPAGG